MRPLPLAQNLGGEDPGALSPAPSGRAHPRLPRGALGPWTHAPPHCAAFRAPSLGSHFQTATQQLWRWRWERAGGNSGKEVCPVEEKRFNIYVLKDLK